MHGPARAGDLAHDELGEVARERFGSERSAARGAELQPVDPVRRPVAVLRLPGQQIPPPLPGNEVVRLELQRLVAVEATHALVVADRGGQVAEDGGIHLGVLRVGPGVGGPGAARRTKRRHLASQSVGQDVLELGERAGAGVLDSRDAGGRLQSDRHGDRFVVVQQEWRQLGARPEPVAAAPASHRVDGVAELAQPGHVVADGAVGDAEPLGQLRAAPVGPRLQQAEQCQKSRRS